MDVPALARRVLSRRAAHKRELAFAASRLSTIEINGTFYSLQRPSSFAPWYADTPDDFVFSVKGGRFITHMKKLRERRHALANFFASGVLALREKLGPILWQLPPKLGFDAERLEAFFALAAALYAARRPGWRASTTSGSSTARFTTTDADRPMRHALEVRHDSFLDAGVPRAAARARDRRGRRRHRRQVAVAAGARRPTSATCACTARTSCTSAATRRRRSTTGPRLVRRWRDARARRLHLLRQRREGARAVRRDGAGRPARRTARP